MLEPETIPAIADYLRNIAFDKTGFEWSYYTTLSLTFKRNLRHLFSELDFAGRVEDAPLMSAVTFLQGICFGKASRHARSVQHCFQRR